MAQRSRWCRSPAAPARAARRERSRSAAWRGGSSSRLIVGAFLRSWCWRSRRRSGTATAEFAGHPWIRGTVTWTLRRAPHPDLRSPWRRILRGDARMSPRTRSPVGRIGVRALLQGATTRGFARRTRKTGLPPGLPKHRRRQRRTKLCSASLAGWRTDFPLCRAGLRSLLAGERHRERRAHGRWRWLSTTSDASLGFLRSRLRVISRGRRAQLAAAAPSPRSSGGLACARLGCRRWPTRCPTTTRSAPMPVVPPGCKDDRKDRHVDRRTDRGVDGRVDGACRRT